MFSLTTRHYSSCTLRILNRIRSSRASRVTCLTYFFRQEHTGFFNFKSSCNHLIGSDHTLMRFHQYLCSYKDKTKCKRQSFHVFVDIVWALFVFCIVHSDNLSPLYKNICLAEYHVCVSLRAKLLTRILHIGTFMCNELIKMKSNKQRYIKSEQYKKAMI